MLEAGKEAGDLLVPLLPVVTAGCGVELELEIALSEIVRKSAIGAEQGFLFAGCKPEVRHMGGICGFLKEERVARTLRGTADGAEEGAESLPLADAVDGEGTAGHIERGADSSDKREQIGMVEGDADGTVAAHRYADDGTAGATGGGGKTMLRVGNEVLHYVILVSVARRGRGVDVVR